MSPGHRIPQQQPPTGSGERPRTTLVFRSAVLLLIGAVILGGSSEQGPLNDAGVQILSLTLVAVLILGREDWGATFRQDKLLWLVSACVAAVPLLHLIPLPPAVWQSFPGRDVAVASLTLLGEAESWRTHSLYPWRTGGSFLSLVPALVILYLTASLPQQKRLDLLLTLVGLAVASAALGVLQSAGGGNAFHLYEFTHRGYSTGFFANRNAQADFLLVGLIACGALLATARASDRPLWVIHVLAAASLLLVASILTTGSRTGIVLLVGTFAAGLLFLLVSTRKMSTTTTTKTLVAAALIAVSAGSGALLFYNPVVQRSISRFSGLQDARPTIWEDTTYAIGQFWPVGSGMGTFVPVFAAAERLETVSKAYVNRAHNEYLELTLEAGALAPLVIITVAIFVLFRIRSLLRLRAATVQAICAFAFLSWVILALHSVVDYPLRNQSMLVVAGLLMGLLARELAAAGAPKKN